MLSNVVPFGFVKKLAGAWLSLSYYHSGMRCRITDRFAYKQLDKPAEDGRDSFEKL